MNGIYEEFRIAVHSVWQRRWLALAVAWAICLVGWGIIALIPNRYESTARIFVQTQSLLSDKVGMSEAEQQKDIDRVRQTLGSAENLEKVVRGTDLAASATTDKAMAGIVDALRKAITVKQTQDNLIEISAQSSGGGRSDRANAALAKAIAGKLIDIFVSENLTGNRAENDQTMRFLDDQLASRQRALADAEAKKSAFEAQYAGLLPGVGSIDQRMEAARAELSTVESNLVAAQSSLAAVNGQMASTPASIAGPGGGAGPTASRITALQGQLAEAQAKGWTDQHPDVVAMRSEISRLRPLAAGEGRGGGGGGSPNPLYVTMRSMQAEKQATAAALASRKAQLEADMAAFTAKQAQQPEVAAQAQALSRDYDVMKAQYDKLLQDREDVRLRGDVSTRTDAVKFRVIDPPSDPRVPVAPKRPLLLAGVLVLGIAGGIAAAFALGQLRPVFATPARLAAASGLPVLGGIRETLTAPARVERRQKLVWFAGGAGALAGVFALLIVVEFARRALV